jgi:hypothetical protein
MRQGHRPILAANRKWSDFADRVTQSRHVEMPLTAAAPHVAVVRTTPRASRPGCKLTDPKFGIQIRAGMPDFLHP